MNFNNFSSYSRLDKLSKVSDWTVGTETPLPTRKVKEPETDFTSVDRTLATLKKSASRSLKPVKKPLKTKFTPKTVGYAKTVTKPRDSSIKINPAWEVAMQLEFSRMENLYLSPEDPVDLKTVGTAGSFDKRLDKISVKNPLAINPVATTFPATASDDQTLMELAETTTGPKIVSTEVVLACLMSTLKSVYSFDLLVTKKGDTLVIDKRDGGVVDYVSVNENASEPPEVNDTINSAEALKLESTMLLQAFRQQSSPGTLTKYRSIDLNGTTLLYRTTIHGEVDDKLVNSYVLNEFDYKAQGSGSSFDWRSKLQSQRGAVIATEMKNNSFKLSRFMTEAILSSADVKLGFVSRKNVRDRKSHQLLLCMSVEPDVFMGSLLDVNKGFGVLKAVTDVMMEMSDGRYVLVRDPVKNMLVIYAM